MTQTMFEEIGPGCWQWRRTDCGQSRLASCGRVQRTAEPLSRRWQATVGESGAVGHGLTRLAAVDAAEHAADSLSCPEAVGASGQLREPVAGGGRKEKCGITLTG